MSRLLIRLLERLAILGLGIASVWLIVFVVFDFADQRLPWAVALSVTYGIAAYVVLPRVVRIGLKVVQRKRVPHYTITGDGLPGDPVNLALIGTSEQLRSAFAGTGWLEADRLGIASSWRMVRAFVFNTPYPRLRSVRSICLDEARTSVSRNRSTTALASATTCAFGP